MKRQPVVEFVKDFFKTQDFVLKERNFGEKHGKELILNLYEGCYLLEKGRIKSNIDFNKAVKKGIRKDKEFFKKYLVYRDLKDKGFIVKTGLKYGSDFRVYEEKVKHSKWIVNVVSERDKFKWQEFAAKNRVGHSTRKKVLFAIVDDEGEVSYYETDWIKL